jgi:hypothetical protein
VRLQTLRNAAVGAHARSTDPALTLLADVDASFDFDLNDYLNIASISAAPQPSAIAMRCSRSWPTPSFRMTCRRSTTPTRFFCPGASGHSRNHASGVRSRSSPTAINASSPAIVSCFRPSTRLLYARFRAHTCGQANFFQSDRRRKQNASLAQVIDHHGDNSVAPISACRFPECSFGDGSIILPSKGPNLKVCLEFAEMGPASL